MGRGERHEEREEEEGRGKGWSMQRLAMTGDSGPAASH